MKENNMKFKEANPQDETYWWVLDEDGTATVVYIEHLKNKEVKASYTGVAEFFDAKTLDYLGEAVQKTSKFIEQQLQIAQLRQSSVINNKLSDKDILVLDNFAKEHGVDDVHFKNMLGTILEGNDIVNETVLDKIVDEELNREKIAFADHLIALFPSTMTQTDILKMLESAVSKTKEGKDIKHLKNQGIITKDSNTHGSLPSFGVVDKKQKYGKKMSPAEQELHDMEANTKQQKEKTD